MIQFKDMTEYLVIKLWLVAWLCIHIGFNVPCGIMKLLCVNSLKTCREMVATSSALVLLYFCIFFRRTGKISNRASCSMGTGNRSMRGVELTTDLPLVLSLAILLPALHIILEIRGTTFIPFTY